MRLEQDRSNFGYMPTLELYRDDPEQVYALVEMVKYYFKYWFDSSLINYMLDMFVLVDGKLMELDTFLNFQPIS